MRNCIHTRERTALLLAAAAAMAVAGGCHGRYRGNFHVQIGSSTLQETVRKSFTAGKVQALRIHVGAGDVSVSRTESDSDEIRITAVKVLSGDRVSESMRPMLDRIHTKAALDGSTLAISEDYPDMPSGVSAVVNYELTVPRRLALDVETGSGDMKVKGIEGGLTLNSGSGDIELAQVGGPLNVTSASGSVSAEGVDATSTLHVETSSGDIKIDGAHTNDAVLTADVTNQTISSQSGSVTYRGNAARHLKINTASGDIETKLEITLANPLSVEIASVSGDVSLVFPPGSYLDLHANSLSGSVSVDDSLGPMLKSDREDEHRLDWHGGANPLKVESTSGDISIGTK